jgi:tetratricopeptide (TPR) repeat protein
MISRGRSAPGITRLLLLTLTLLMISAALASGQARRHPSVSRQIQNYRVLQRSNPQAALDGLEALYRNYPTDPDLRLQLGRLYRDLGDSDKAQTMFRGLRSDYPQSIGYRDELLITLFRAGLETEAREILGPVFRGESRRAGDYEGAANVLRNAGRFDLVPELLTMGLASLEADNESGRQRLLRRLMDQHHLSDRQDEILRLLSREIPLLKNRQLRDKLRMHGENLIADCENPASLVALADSLSGSDLSPEMTTVMSRIYLSVGDYAAFAHHVLRTSLTGRQRGEWLLRSAERCLDLSIGSSEQRDVAAEEILVELLATPRLADDLALRGRYRLAILGLEQDGIARLQGQAPSADDQKRLRTMLADLRDGQPESPVAAEALVRELTFLRGTLGEAAEADSLLRSWFLRPERNRDPFVAWALELQLGENLMALERFEDARAHYTYMLRTIATPSVREWAHYHLSELMVLGGDGTAAQDSLAALAKSSPGSVLANDALDLALLLAESGSWPEPVRELLATALRLEFSWRPGEAADRLITFAREFSSDPTAPALLYRGGMLLAEAYRGGEAVAAWVLLADSHPDDFRAPQALEKAARLSYRMRDPAAAREYLERILTEHPDYLLRPAFKDLQDKLAEDMSS